MKRIILICLLCIVFIFSVAPSSQATSVTDYSVVINSLTLGEKAENLPDFIMIKPNNNKPHTDFSGKYGDITIYGKIWEGRVCYFYITPPYDLDTKKVDEIAAILKNKYGPPSYSMEDVYGWEKNGMSIHLDRLRTGATKPGEGGPGTISGHNQDLMKLNEYVNSEFMKNYSGS